MDLSPDHTTHNPWQHNTTSTSKGIQYLKQAVHSIDNSRNNIIHGLENLESQTTTIKNIHENMGIFNAKLDISEYKLRQINNPLTKQQYTHTNQSDLVTREFFMSGHIKKYTKTFKNWYTSRYTLDRTTFKYQRFVKPREIIVNLEDCTFRAVYIGDKLYDNSICKHNDVLEIKQIMYTDGIVQYHAFRTNRISEFQAFIHYLTYYIGRTVEGVRTDHKTASHSEEDIILDMFNNKLDELHILSSHMGTIVDQHTENIQIISNNMEKSNNRVLVCADKTKSLQ